MLDMTTATPMSLGSSILYILLALVLGIGTAVAFSFKVKHTASMSLTLAIMPASIALVIMLVNGNIGAGVAVAGAFALVRFRSMPGTAREIAAIFADMAIGLACGMGQWLLALIFFGIMAVVVVGLTLLGFGEKASKMRLLRITIPEDLDYYDLFDDLLSRYTVHNELVRVKSTNMGTLFDLSYEVILKDERKTKEFLDAIRCRNGNLSVSLGRVVEKNTL